MHPSSAFKTSENSSCGLILQVPNALDVIDRSDARVIWSRAGNTSAKPAFSATPGPFLA